MHDGEKERRTQLLEGARQLMRSPEGRGLCRWLLDISRVFNAGYSPESGEMYFVQGQRSVGLALLQLVITDNAAHLATLMEEKHG